MFPGDPPNIYMGKKEDEEDEESLYDEYKIQWSDLIFLPFNSIFQFFVMIAVIHKIVIGPLEGIFGLASNCSNAMDYNVFTIAFRNIYKYPACILYTVDTLLHILHRQMADKAVRREHLPKSAFLIILDVLALIPFRELLTEKLCTFTFWPNILSFIEFIIVYRIVEYFDLKNTHCCWKQYIGFTILVVSFVNCLTCFLLLLTFTGLCKYCPYRRKYFFDWRKYILYKNETFSTNFTWYFYGYQYLFSFIMNSVYEETKPSTLMEFLLACAFMATGYMLEVVVVFPKMFAEAILSVRRICTFHPLVQKIVNETKRRNPSPTAYVSVHQFYDLMWKKRGGMTSLPVIMNEFPRYLCQDIREDLVWHVFYHSPTLRKTTSAFKRYLSDFIRCDYKLPGAKLFAGPHCHTNMYYLKSGVVQLLSVDDGVTPLMSVTSGTLFGDICFFVPPLRRKISVKCLTYCEILFVTRKDLLKCLHRYPDDRRNVFALAKDKIRHAQTLYSCKGNVKGLDRVEDEGMDWLKRRWWEISDCVDQFKAKGKKMHDKCELPPEESMYHCAKYIGQLVLSTTAQLKQSSLFVNDQFPWVLAPNSSFYRVWYNIVIVTVSLVLIFFPPNITKKEMSFSFIRFRYLVDFVYIADIFVSLFTSVDSQEYSTPNFSSVLLVRFKRMTFVLDILAALRVEEITVLIGKPEFYYICMFNRLLKIYLLFPNEGQNWRVGQDPMFPIYVRIFFSYFTYMYMTAYLIFVIVQYVPGVSAMYFYGNINCTNTNLSLAECIRENRRDKVLALDFLFEYMYAESLPQYMGDILLKMLISYHAFLLFTHCKSRFVATMYLKFRDIVNYQRFVSTLVKYYKHHNIHRDLLKRLNRYLDCHWKYHNGVDVMHPNSLKDEPYDIFWKVQGEVAEKIISQSMAFIDADPMFIRELAYATKFLILPKKALLFLFGTTCKNVTWIVQGYVKCEFHNEEGELLKTFFGPGQMLSVTPTLFGKPSFRTYIAYTDCEILYTTINEFFTIIRRYPQEWRGMNNAMREFGPQLEELMYTYVKKHVDYQRKLHDSGLHGGRSTHLLKETEESIHQSKQKMKYYIDPESNFIKYWMPFRAVSVLVSITSSSLQGGGGAHYKSCLSLVATICNVVALFDIFIKLFLAYYDERGIMITTRWKIVLHYLSRGFIMDVIGALPWETVLMIILEEEIPKGHGKLINTAMEFAHIYLLTGYLNYLADTPSVNSALIRILKWQLITLLAMLAGSHFLVNFCVDFSFDSHGNLVNMTRLASCWMPGYIHLDQNLTNDQLHMIFAQSINLAQSGLLNMNYGKFRITEKGNIIVACSIYLLGIVYWYVVAYSITLLVLVSRSDSLFHHGVQQLRKFLRAERVEKKLIYQTMSHFNYWWIRTKGINVHTLIFERIGVVFRQDLSHYFYQKTYAALDTLLEGGEQFERHMASVSTIKYFLPNEYIMREMDLMPHVFVVHRGKVVIKQKNKKIALLTKGAIFGQLTGTIPRPVKSTAIADGYTDILQMSINDFEDLVNKDIRQNILHNPQSQDDFMATKKVYHESPNDTIKYILRGRKIIKLPWMSVAREAHRKTWYTKWLYLSWLFGPAITAYMTSTLIILPEETIDILLFFFMSFDLLHLVYTVTEYFTLEVAVVHNKCVNRKVGWRIFKGWRLYMSVFSLVVPYLTWVTGYLGYQLARLVRLSLLYDFYRHYCRGFKSKMAPFLLNLIILTLLLHCMTCGWIHVACRDDEFPVSVPTLPLEFNMTVDYSEWIMADQRRGGCARITRNFIEPGGEKRTVSFIVPKHWSDDYIVALTFIVILHTHTLLDTVMQLTVTQIYYKIFINIVIYLIDIWLMSAAVSFIYTQYRELYQYDYNVRNLNMYLLRSGLAPSLLRAVGEYTNHLWKRQKGNWMPELAMQAAPCLREDIFCALYLYHILTPPLFRKLPEYFTRQMVARIQRIVIFPGKSLVKEGDLSSVIYFIHEGEIEKWQNYFTNDRKLATILSANAYFGLIPGLFPNSRFHYTYVSRTVVDIIYLRLRDWQDLLLAYPDIKVKLYEAAIQLKSEFKKEGQSIRTPISSITPYF